MTRTELMVKMMQRHSHLSCPMVENSVKHLLEYLSQALCAGERIEVRGFGSFERMLKKPRLARNPKTGAYLKTSGKYGVRFKCGKELRALVDAARAQNVVIMSDE